MEPYAAHCPVCRRQVDSSMIAGPDAVDESLHPLLAVNMHAWEPGKQI